MFRIDPIQPEALDRLRALVDKLDFSNDIRYFEHVLGVECDHKIILIGQNAAGQDRGLCVVNFTPLYPLFRRLGIPEIQDLNVIPDARRHGMGAALVTAAENLARARGATDMGIGVGLTAPYGPAQRLYVQMGYVPDGAGIAIADSPTPIRTGEMHILNDDVCLYMVKRL